MNKIASLTEAGQVLSDYGLPTGQRLWVLTMLDPGGNTTVMLPDDY